MEKHQFKTENGDLIELTMNDMCKIHSVYEVLATKEYLMEAYGLDSETAQDMAGEVRRQMDKYGFDEEEAIDEVKDDYCVASRSR